MIRRIKDYLSQIWPEIIGVSCSVILFLISNKDICNTYKVLIVYSPIVLCFPVHYFIRKYKKKATEKMVNDSHSCAISCLSEMKRISHDYPTDNKDPGRLKIDMTAMCEQVFQTLAQYDDNKTVGYNNYCVFVSLLNNENGELYINPLYRNQSDWSDGIFEKMPQKIRLKDNSPYHKLYESYTSLKKVDYEMTSQIKSKISKGKYKSSYALNVGVDNLPYNSSCVLPILPFHNKRNGDEIQGFMTIVTEQANAFSKEGRNKEIDSYFETVSGYLYKICIKTSSEIGK